MSAGEVLHLIEVPGRDPVEIGMFRQRSCKTCLAEARRDDARVVVLHSAQCAGARAVSDEIGDGGSTDDADDARRALADEAIDEVMDDDQRLLKIVGTADLSEGERAALRGELAEIYLAGLRRGERLVLAVARAGLARLDHELAGVIAELGTWPGERDAAERGTTNR